MESNLFKATTSSREALNWAFTWSRIRGSTDIQPEDLLIGISQTHGEESPLFQILQPFNISKDELFARVNFHPDKLPPSSNTLPSEDFLAPDSVSIIKAGLNLAQKNNHEEKGLMRLHDLFGGVLITPSSARKVLEEVFSISSVGISLDEISQIYLDYLGNEPEKNLKQLLNQRFQGFQPALEMAVSGFKADTRSKQDLVGVGTEVNAFSYLIANRDLQPPLAIGLFGDWGSGMN